MFDLTALGEMLIDFTYQGKSASGQKLFAQNAGGAPANVAATVVKLGGKSAFIGKAGNDMHGKFLKETLESNGIDASGFTLSSDYFTTLAFVDVKPDGEREFSFARNHGADKMLEDSDIPENILKNTKILHVGSVSLTDEPTRSATYYAVKKAKEFGAVISYDPNYRKSLWKDEATAIKEMRAMLKLADIVKISDEETALLTDYVEAEKSAEVILAKGASIVVVTLGKDGAYVLTKEGGTYVSGYKANAVDATGAGDSFFGGFLTQFAKSNKTLGDVTLQNAKDFANYGNAVASLCVEGYGAIPSLPDEESVKKRLILK